MTTAGFRGARRVGESSGGGSPVAVWWMRVGTSLQSRAVVRRERTISSNYWVEEPVPKWLLYRTPEDIMKLIQAAGVLLVIALGTGEAAAQAAPNVKGQ